MKSSAEIPRRAGVSSFGFGGTNYHIVLEEYHSEHQSGYRLHNTPQSILINAPTTEQLIDKCHSILQQLQSETEESYWVELIKESETEIERDAARIGFVAGSIAEASHKLQKGIDTLQKSNSTHWEHPLGIFYRQTGLETEGKVVALFSGQSSQYLEMGRELAIDFPALRETYQQVDRLLEGDGLEPVSKAVFPPTVFDEAQQEQQRATLQKTEIAQPAIAAFSTGLYKILQQAGFQPDFVAGHSFGELTALWAAGVLTDEDYFFLVKERGQAMATPSTEAESAMLAVKGDVSQIKTAIENWDVAIANWNSPQQVVLAGNKTEIIRAQAQLEQQGYTAVILPVSAAFHTPSVEHAQAPFAKAVEAVTFNPPQIPVFTNVSANPYPQEPQQCQEILKKHLLSQVLFQEEIENIYAAGGTCFVEFGPRSILTYLVKEILGDRNHLAVALNPSRQKDSDLQLREAVMQLRVAGLSLPNLDPYQIGQTIKKEQHPLNVRLTSVNYVSEKTQKAFERTLCVGQVTGEQNNGMKEDKFKHLSAPKTNNIKLNLPSETLVSKTGERGGEIQSKSAQSNLTLTRTMTYNSGATTTKPNGNSVKLATMNDLSMISTESNLPPKRSDATEIPLDRILSSLEYSIGQFHQHQQETLEVHKQYLSYQSQYAQTFLELMQQQNQLWANVQTAPQEIQVKTAVLESAERSMMKFQEHQANTLRVHEQYLNHQADYAKNFFLLTQQSYAQFLEGDYQYSDRSLPLLSLTRSEVITTEPITTKQIVTEPETNGNGHHDLAEVEPDNGNGHHPVSEVEPETNGNGHHPVAEVEASLSLESSNVAIAPAPEIDFAILSGTLLDVVSEKTGYPAEMLELDMDMEADLGIDSIKRVEIMGALQEEMPELPQPDLEDLGDLRTLSQIIEYLRDFDRSTSVESVAATQPDLKTTLLTIISEKTGYPLPSLNLEMNLKADLGIDLVKQRAIFDSLQEQIPDILPTEAELEISELDTIAQLLDYLKSDGAQETQKKTSLSPIPL